MRQILLAQNAFMSKHICISGLATWIMASLPWHFPAAFYQFNWEWYMWEDQVARRGGVVGGERGLKGRNKFPSVWAVTPGRPRSASLTTAGYWGDTLGLDLEIRLWGEACVHSFLMTDVTVNCGELVRVTLTLRLGCAKQSRILHVMFGYTIEIG